MMLLPERLQTSVLMLSSWDEVLFGANLGRVHRKPQALSHSSMALISSHEAPWCWGRVGMFRASQ